MTDYQRVDVVIYRAERTLNSHDGNPGWKFHTNAGVYRMTTDASLGYGVENFVWSERKAETWGDDPSFVIGNPAEPVVTLLLEKNRVSYIEHDGKVLS